MRLDHLLSKETWLGKAEPYPRSDKGLEIVSLFNLEGMSSKHAERAKYGGLAQLGERLPCKQEVSGSIPLISTRWRNGNEREDPRTPRERWANSSAG